ncbi:unnamed protein product, partial [Staurois parvus]
MCPRGGGHGSAEQCTGVSRTEDRGQQSTGRWTGVTAGRAEDRGHCWQGRGQ